jgi:hypothetical protein
MRKEKGFDTTQRASPGRTEGEAGGVRVGWQKKPLPPPDSRLRDYLGANEVRKGVAAVRGEANNAERGTVQTPCGDTYAGERRVANPKRDLNADRRREKGRCFRRPRICRSTCDLRVCTFSLVSSARCQRRGHRARTPHSVTPELAWTELARQLRPWPSRGLWHGPEEPGRVLPLSPAGHYSGVREPKKGYEFDRLMNRSVIR